MGREARSRCVAVVWRIVCGLTRLSASDGSEAATTAAYLSTSAWIPNRESGRPQRSRKRHSDGARPLINGTSSLTVLTHSGQQRTSLASGSRFAPPGISLDSPSSLIFRLDIRRQRVPVQKAGFVDRTYARRGHARGKKCRVFGPSLVNVSVARGRDARGGRGNRRSTGPGRGELDLGAWLLERLGALARFARIPVEAFGRAVTSHARRPTRPADLAVADLTSDSPHVLPHRGPSRPCNLATFCFAWLTARVGGSSPDNSGHMAA